jgi:hypothetical protein
MEGMSIARFTGDGACFVRGVVGGPTSFARTALGGLMQAIMAIRMSVRMGPKLLTTPWARD